MNKAETDSIAIDLKKYGFIPASDSSTADFIILNTCSVRKTAEERIWGRIGHYKFLKKQIPHLKLIIAGCMAERLKEKLLEDGVVDIVIGNFEKHHIGEIIHQTIANTKQTIHTELTEYQFFDLHSYDNNGFKAFVPIMHGCNNWCSYCIVPHVRGHEVSRRSDQILKEIKILEKQGIREITLLGQNVNSYYYCQDGQVLDFPGLLTLIAGNVKQLEWIRFLTSHPKDLSDQLIRVLVKNRIFCRHIHLPVQHGSNRILRLMGRGYTREQFLILSAKIRENIPDVSLTSDILIGFPGENEDDFRLTLELMEKVQFDNAFTYKYNPREGTKAYQMEDSVPEAVKHQRLSRVIDLQKSITRKTKEARIGKKVKVLSEAVSKKNKFQLLGRTEKDEMVVFPSDENTIGCFVYIKLLRLEGNTFYGEEE